MRDRARSFFTIKQIQGLFGFSRGTVVRWIVTGRLRASKLGGGRLWRIRERDFKKFIKGENKEK